MLGCVADAPHENPYDPSSPSYRGSGTIYGTVTVRDKPEVPLAEVWIHVASQRKATKSDSAGFFWLEDIGAGKVSVLFLRENFSPETVTVALNVGESKRVDVAMNGYPTIASAVILSRRIDGSSPVYFVDVRALVSDPNGAADIDSVWFLVEDERYPMDYNIGNKQFEVRLQSSVLPVEYLIGKQLYVLARDRYAAEGLSYPFALAQPIEVVALPQHPQSGDTVTVPLLFRWSSPQVSFNYSYSLTLARLQGTGANQTVVWKTTIEPIRSDVTSYLYALTLPSGRYSWAIAIVDVNGNWSQSAEQTFIIR